MGDSYTMPQTFSSHELSSGWSFKQTDDTSEDAWLSVKKVPSTVQQDLLDHKKYVCVWPKGQFRVLTPKQNPRPIYRLQ